MKISITHQRFANRLRNQRVLEHPEEFLGPNWKDVLNFWIFLDTLTEDKWKIIRERYWALYKDDRRASSTVAYIASLEVINENVVDCVYYVYVATYFSVTDATRELIGSHILREQGKSLLFLPLFLNV